MSNESQPDDRRPLQRASAPEGGSFAEARLKSLRPQMPRIDYERLDALLADERENQPAAKPLPIEPYTVRSWGAIAAAWCFGLLVGVIVTLLAQSHKPPGQIASDEQTTVDPVRARGEMNPSSASVAAITDDSEVPHHDALSTKDDVALRWAQPSVIDDATWLAAFSGEDLRASSYIYTVAARAAPSAHLGLASGVETTEWTEAVDRPKPQKVVPIPAPEPPTSRRLLDELFNDGASNVL